ncbi:Imm10 family immunity protein [Acidovorax temperans]
MSVFSFRAECVVSEHPDGVCHLVGFADNKFDTEIYLTLQRSYEEEEQEQDIQLGMNTYHIEWCDQEKSGYGGITQFVLKPTSVEVCFEPKMAESLGGIERVSISFSLQAGEHQALKEALERIFQGSNCLGFADA